jgi:hypothetical protein
MILKFRAWDYQKMLYDVYPTKKSETVYDPQYNNGEGIYRKVHEEIMQYIGIQDDQNNEVYVGDIFEHEYDKGLLRWLVVFKCGCFGVTNISNSPISDFHPISSPYYFVDRIKVGNKFENPNLMDVWERR